MIKVPVCLHLLELVILILLLYHPFQLPKIKVKGIPKKIRKIQEFEKKMQEKEFDRDFFRMFWPDNV